MICIDNLSKRYGDAVIFEHASYSFPDTGLICILGPSGCGKSTLLNLLAGFDSAYEGDIRVHGSSLAKMSAEELCAYRRNNVGFVFQNYHLIGGYSAVENIVTAADVLGTDRSVSMRQAEQLLEKLGLAEKCSQKVETLSGGQKQRVAIARALVNDPSVILADEPTGALDRKNSSEIMGRLKGMAEDRLVIVITHDRKCAEYADEIVTIEDGKLNGKSKVAPGKDSIVTPDMEAVAAKETETAVLKTGKRAKIALWQRGWKNCKIHLLRNIAIASAIAAGVLCFALSLSSGNVMERAILDFQEKNTAFHNGYIKADSNAEELMELLHADERLDNIYPQYVLYDVTIEIEGQSVTMAEKYPMAKATEELSYGVMPKYGADEIAISPSLAAQFDKQIQNLVGKEVTIACGDNQYAVTVSGIFNASYDDFFVSSDVEQKMYEASTEAASEEAYAVSYDVTEFEDIVPVSNELQEQGINSQNASAEVGTFLNTFRNLNRLFLVVSVLILAIGLFISIILLAKQQKTRMREVGLLSALGYTKGNIRGILFCEGIFLSVMSALCSGIFTVLVLTISGVFGFTLVYTLSQLLITLGMTVVLVLLIYMFFGWRLVNTEPAEALRQ